MAKKRRKFTQCPNCGYSFEETNNYCPNCGQENHDLNVPVKHLIAEFFEGTLHFDTKIWHTLKLLLLKPGLLTEKFNIGQRASYVPPFRLYVFVSLVFFFVVALSTKSEDKITEGDQAPQAILPGVTVNTNLPDSLLTGQEATDLQKAEALLKENKNVETLRSSVNESEFMAEFVDKFARFTSKGEEARQKLLKNVSFMMFALMPFFAFLLYLYYRRLRRNYVEHLMFSIHLHTFYFILLIVAMLLGQVFPKVDIESIILLIMALYLFLALRQVYKRSLWSTFLSLFPISFVYLITLAVFFLGTIAISVLLS